MTAGVLLITERSDLAADLLVLRLREIAAPFWRLNCDEFPTRLTVAWSPRGDFQVWRNGTSFFRCKDVHSAWYRYTPQPQLGSLGLEPDIVTSARDESRAFLDGIFEGADWRWVNRPSAVLRARNKLLQLQYARRQGFSVPETLVTNDPAAVRSVAGRWHDETGLVAKAVVGGKITVAGQAYGLFTQTVSPQQLEDDWSVRASPCIFQRRIPRTCDVRVTVAGSAVFATEILFGEPATAPVDWRLAEPSEVSYRPHLLPAAIETASRSLVCAFGLVFGALDFILTPDGSYVFLELNPSGQWGWLEAATGQPITSAIVEALTAAST